MPRSTYTTHLLLREELRLSLDPLQLASRHQLLRLQSLQFGLVYPIRYGRRVSVIICPECSRSKLPALVCVSKWNMDTPLYLVLRLPGCPLLVNGMG